MDMLYCSNNVLKLIRRIHVPTAQRLRSISGGHSGLGCVCLTTLKLQASWISL